MTAVRANGTDAKDIAVHFISITSERATPAIMGKTINQAKVLLSSGYTKDEIIKAIDYIVNVKKITLYSLGYVNTSINNILAEMEKHEKKEQVKQKIKSMMSVEQSEVVDDSDSKQRNKDKLNRFGVQSRFGKESFSDLLEGNGQDN